MTAAMRTVSLALSRFFPRQAVRRTVRASTTSLLASPGSPDRTTEMPRSALAVETHENWLEQHLPQHGRSTRAQKRRVASWPLGQPPWAASGSAGQSPLGELGV